MNQENISKEKSKIKKMQIGARSTCLFRHGVEEWVSMCKGTTLCLIEPNLFQNLQPWIFGLSLDKMGTIKNSTHLYTYHDEYWVMYSIFESLYYTLETNRTLDANSFNHWYVKHLECLLSVWGCGRYQGHKDNYKYTTKQTVQTPYS